MSDVIIRPFDPADGDAVGDLSLRAWEPVFDSFRTVFGAALYERLHPDWRRAQAEGVREVLAEHESWVATSGEVVGFVSVAFDTDESAAEIFMIAVDPDHQRRGVGSALMRAALSEIRARGATLVTVSTGGDPGHAPARRLYESWGFTPFPQVFYSRLLD